MGVAQQLPMLAAVLFVQLVVKYTGVVVGNLFFFSGGRKMVGKSSFAVFGFGAGEAVCKCAFTYALDFLIYFINFIGRM